MELDKCMKEASACIQKFLMRYGGYENGYLTYVSGRVDVDKVGRLHWQTPSSKEEYTALGIAKRGEALYEDVQKIMKKHGVDRLEFRTRDIEHGTMETEIVYVTEMKKKVYLS